jgi:hypothetical protein
MVQVSPDAIAKIEKGQYRCRYDLAERLDAVLETGGAPARAVIPSHAQLRAIRTAGDDAFTLIVCRAAA